MKFVRYYYIIYIDDVMIKWYIESSYLNFKKLAIKHKSDTFIIKLARKFENVLFRGRKDMGWDGMGWDLSVGWDIRGTLAWDGFPAGYPKGG